MDLSHWISSGMVATAEIAPILVPILHPIPFTHSPTNLFPSYSSRIHRNAPTFSLMHQLHAASYGQLVLTVLWQSTPAEEERCQWPVRIRLQVIKLSLFELYLSVYLLFFFFLLLGQNGDEEIVAEIMGRCFCPSLITTRPWEGFHFVGQEIKITEATDSYGAVVWPSV